MNRDYAKRLVMNTYIRANNFPMTISDLTTATNLSTHQVENVLRTNCELFECTGIGTEMRVRLRKEVEESEQYKKQKDGIYVRDEIAPLVRRVCYEYIKLHGKTDIETLAGYIGISETRIRHILGRDTRLTSVGKLKDKIYSIAP